MAELQRTLVWDTRIQNRRFPQELIDMVIDNLYSDIKALKQCSLVCKDCVSCAVYPGHDPPTRAAL